jgi:hypothetical protein
MVRSLRAQSQQLLVESQILEDEVLAGAKSADHPTEEMSERRDHSRNQIGKVVLLSQPCFPGVIAIKRAVLSLAAAK